MLISIFNVQRSKKLTQYIIQTVNILYPNQRDKLRSINKIKHKPNVT